MNRRLVQLLALTATATLAVVSCTTDTVRDGKAGGAATPPAAADADAAVETTGLQAAAEQCPAPGIVASDDGQVLLIDHNDPEGTHREDIFCVLAFLSVPESVVARMGSTRAVDGMQTAEWDGYTATWTYHPDNGLDIIIEE